MLRRWRLLPIVFIKGIGYLMLASALLVLALRWFDPPVSALMLERWFASQFETPAFELQHHWLDWQQMSSHLPVAMIAAEDQQFPDHLGFDFNSIQANFEHNQTSRRIRGGSTISQQLAKNLFLWPERSYLRKALEVWFTLLMESLWPKQRILELYLNVIELDRGVFGVEAGSQHFFGKSSSQLNASESALLAAVLPNPFLLRVNRPSARVRARQQWILRQMRQLGGEQLLERL